jgi:dienelactone hydrolase
MTKIFATIGLMVATIPATSILNAQVGHPALTGPYAVGRQSVVWTDSSRRDPTDTTRWREVSAWIWYPANLQKGAGSQSPLPDDWETRRLETLRTRLGPDIANAMREFTVYAQPNAPLLAGTSRLPVLLFTPGLSWLATDYSVLLEDLASHGYVVVGYSPVGFSDPVVFPDGRVVGRSLGNGASIGTDQSYIFDDGAFVLRAIRDLDRHGFLRNRIDLGHVGAFGHSIGGVTSLVLAARDTAVRAAINIDGDVMGDARDVRPLQPVLLISSDLPKSDESPADWSAKRVDLFHQGLERSEARRTGEWTNLSSRSVSAHRIRIIGARHLNFTDVALASSHAVSREARWMKFGSIDAERGLTITTELVRSFFDQIFGRADAGDLFTSPDRHFAELRLE